MLRVTALFWIAVALQVPAMAQEPQQPKEETVQVHGHALQLSCSKWKRNQDGSWINVESLLVGTETVKDVTLRGAKETGALEAKCQSGSAAAVAPQPGGNLTRHTRGHTHGPPAPADGT
jgi:hypothetical protein